MASKRRFTGILVGLLAAALAFLTIIQVRSQAEVVRSLETQDNTSLAFLIDDLHDANDQLAAEVQDLSARRDALTRRQSSPVAALNQEATRLKMVAGLVPVTGPGEMVEVDAPLTALDLQDAVNNLRAGGAVAIAIDDARVINGSVIAQDRGQITIDGQPVSGPWTLTAVGNPGSLQPQAQAMVSSLRADPRVRSASFQSLSSLTIQAVVRLRPFVYASA